MKKLIICTNHRANPEQPSCAARGSLLLAERLEQAIAMHGWRIKLERFACLGRCQTGPAVKLAPGGRFICELTPDKFGALLQELEAFASPAPND